jgi:hypothetical protein
LEEAYADAVKRPDIASDPMFVPVRASREMTPLPLAVGVIIIEEARP